MFVYSLNRNNPLATTREKVSLALSIVTVLALTTIGILAFTRTIQFGNTSSLGNGLAWTGAALGYVAIELIGFIIKSVKKKSGAFEEILTKWINAGEPNENRNEVAEEIRSCCEKQNLSLEISVSNITCLPDLFHFLPHLEKLSISGCDFIQNLPESIGNLIQLQKLQLKNFQRLQSLPASLGNLKNLQNLSVFWCRSLRTLPESIGNLLSLQKLSFRNTNLQKIPSSLGNLTNLEKLTISDSFSLKDLPRTLCNLKQLKQLKIEHNPLNTLPELTNLHNLEEISLQSNQLQTLPNWIFQLPKLDYIDASDNLFSADEVARIQQLTSQRARIRPGFRCATSA